MNESKYLEHQNETMGENSFMKTLLKKRLNQKGLTLIELLAVIVILAIVAAIAIPAIGNVIENSRYNAVKADAISAINASNVYFTENSSATEVLISDLTSGGYLQSPGKLAAASTNKVVKVNGGNEITHAAITYSGSKTVTFTSASLTEIEAHPAKGSDAGNKTIPNP